MGTYDTAQICINGHVITEYYNEFPQFRKKYCSDCGASTITSCQNCNTPIRGGYSESFTSSQSPAPSFCHNCGKPYPWVESKLKAARELSDETENLTDDERESLKKSLDDIIRDTPQTPLATTRFKKLAAKAGKVAADGLRDILIDIASEAAKKAIWGV